MSKNFFWNLINPPKPLCFQVEKNVKNIAWPQFIMGIIGLGVSLWALILHIQIKTGKAGELICDINKTINCTKIIGSDYGDLFTIPLGSYGMSYWGIVIAFSSLGTFITASRRFIATWQLIVAAVGALFALILAFIAYVIIQGVCEVCAVVQISCIIHFIITLVSYLRVKSDPLYGQSKAFLRIATTTVIAGFLPLTSSLAALAAATCIFRPKGGSSPISNGGLSPISNGGRSPIIMAGCF